MPALALRTFVGERLRPTVGRDRGVALKVLRCVLGYLREETMERILPSEEGYEHVARIEAERAAVQGASAPKTTNAPLRAFARKNHYRRMTTPSRFTPDVGRW